MFKVGDKIVITGWKDSNLNEEDLGRIVTIKRIKKYRDRDALFCLAFQEGTDPKRDENYVFTHECRKLTPLEELL